jgi:electron transport complex protein RnfE
MSLVTTFTRGIFKENPVFRLLLGMCPTLAVTTEAVNGLAMGLATAFVLVCANIVVSLFRSVIPAKVRIPVFIVIIATFVTVVDLVMNGFVHELHKTLGVFIPLIVVNCVILGRAEAFASRNGPLSSLFDGLGMGLGFTASLTLLGAVRELFGNGTIFGAAIFGAGYHPVIVMILPPGAFITLGLILAAINHLGNVRAKAGA